MDPVPGPPHAFALTRRSIRYGSFPRTGTGLEFREFHEVELPAKTFGEGVLGPTLLEERSLRSALEDLLGRLAVPIAEASLVVPDSWLRLVFSDVDELPRSSSEREEILRWKLKRLVPFKVDELRLSAVEVAPLPDQREPGRLLLAFAAESLLSHVEASFSSYGIRVGRVTNATLALLEAVFEAAGGEGRRTLVHVTDDDYTILYALAGQPALYRHKLLEAGRDEASYERSVRRELRLTRTFVERSLGSDMAAEVHLFAPPGVESSWSTWLREELGATAVGTSAEFVRGVERAGSVEASRVAPLMGAACAMVS